VDAANGRAPALAGVPAELAPLVVRAAEANGLEPVLLAAVARAESGFDPRACSPAGAEGLMQLMPGRARELGVADPYDPAESLQAGARYLRTQLDTFGGDLRLALAAYDTGPDAVLRHGGVPAYSETQAFVASVIADREALRVAEGSGGS
jgi:soluble lytic murein transglycosylase-like protein